MGRRAPSTRAQALGGAVHSTLETFLLTGAWPVDADTDALSIAQSGEGLLGEMRQRVKVGAAEIEKIYEIPPKSGLGPLRTYCVTDFVDRENRHVADHKTTGDLDSPYIKPALELARDPQMLWYGYLEFRDDPGDFYVQHLYYQTRGRRRARKTPKIRVKWRDATENASIFLSTSRIMFDLWANVTLPDDVPHNLDACGDFGGCPHRDVCPHFAAKLPRPRGGSKVNFKELAAQRARQQQQAEQPQPRPAEGQVVPPDTAGAQHVTDAMLDEIAERVFAATDGDPEAWLRSDPGRAALSEIGFGAQHIPRILAWMNGDEAPPEAVAAKAEEEPAEQPPPAEGPFAAVIDAIRLRGGRCLIEEVKPELLAASGKKKFGKNIRASILEKLAIEGVADSNATEIWLMQPEGEAVTTPSAPATDLKPGPAPETVELPPKAEPEPTSPLRRAAQEHAAAQPLTLNSWGAAAFMVGAYPEQIQVPFLHIDAVLEPYYDQAAKELRIAHYLADQYNKGPRYVASLVAAEVQNGDLRPFAGWVIVPAGHPMGTLIGTMFPDSVIWRGA